jgi:hypothetical protein
MMDPVVMLDTDVASAEYKGKPLPVLTKISSAFRPVISFVTYGEMINWAEMRSWAPHNRSRLDTWLGRMPSINSSDTIAVQWGELVARRANEVGQGHRTTRGSRPCASLTAFRLRRSISRTSKTSRPITGWSSCERR